MIVWGIEMDGFAAVGGDCTSFGDISIFLKRES